MSKFHPEDVSAVLGANYTAPASLDDDSGPVKHIVNSLEWHQQVAIAVCLSLFFSSSGVKQPGVLLADDVGVGKTLEALGLVAAITDLID
jgi:hypothetical protein